MLSISGEAEIIFRYGKVYKDQTCIVKMLHKYILQTDLVA
jgi:hypothetical protein